jgi:hypothetical protein
VEAGSAVSSWRKGLLRPAVVAERYEPYQRQRVNKNGLIGILKWARQSARAIIRDGRTNAYRSRSRCPGCAP